LGVTIGPVCLSRVLDNPSVCRPLWNKNRSKCTNFQVGHGVRRFVDEVGTNGNSNAGFHCSLLQVVHRLCRHSRPTDL